MSTCISLFSQPPADTGMDRWPPANTEYPGKPEPLRHASPLPDDDGTRFSNLVHDILQKDAEDDFPGWEVHSPHGLNNKGADDAELSPQS